MKRWLLILIPAVVLGGLIAARVKGKRVEAAEQAKVREMRMKSPPVVSVVPATVRDLHDRYEGVATAEANPLSAGATLSTSGT